MKLATLLLLLLVIAAADDSSLTGKYINGRAWTGMTAEEKTAYLMGIKEGVSILEKEGSGSPDLRRLFGKSRPTEIRDALDDFYHDPANLQIQIWVAMMYFQDKVNGASPEKLSNELASDRNSSGSQSAQYSSKLGGSSSTSRPATYPVETSTDDEFFVINGQVFRAKIYCFHVDKGDRVKFVDGSASGACASAKFINMRTGDACEVWCGVVH